VLLTFAPNGVIFVLDNTKLCYHPDPCGSGWLSSGSHGWEINYREEFNMRNLVTKLDRSDLLEGGDLDG
jgi:hypothetical protein